MPSLVEQHCRTRVAHPVVLTDHPACFRGNFAVLLPSVIVVDVNGFADCKSFLRILRYQQLYGPAARLHPAGSIDPGANAKHNILDGQRFLYPGLFNDFLKSKAGRLVQLLQPEIGQHPVFAGHRHNVRPYAHSHQVKVRCDIPERYVLDATDSLHQLEPHTAA